MILDPWQFKHEMNISNTKNQMTRMKKNRYIKQKGWNLKNILWTQANHVTHAKISTHATHATHVIHTTHAKISMDVIFFDLCQNFIDPHHPSHPVQHLTHATHNPTPMLLTSHMHPHYLTELFQSAQKYKINWNTLFYHDNT